VALAEREALLPLVDPGGVLDFVERRVEDVVGDGNLVVVVEV